MHWCGFDADRACKSLIFRDARAVREGLSLHDSRSDNGRKGQMTTKNELIAAVAEEAKRLGCPFIGVPARNAWGWQYLDMQLTGVRFLVDGVKNIDLPMLQQLDQDVRSSFIEVAHAAL